LLWEIHFASSASAGAHLAHALRCAGDAAGAPDPLRKQEARRAEASGIGDAQTDSLCFGEGETVGCRSGGTGLGSGQLFRQLERTGSRKQRQEGNGRGDAARLLASGILRGVSRAAGKDRCILIDCRLRSASIGTVVWKRSEPRLALGRNKPKAPTRSKPSRWCESTRAERAGCLAATCQSMVATSSWSGRVDGLSDAGHHEDEFQERRIGEDRSGATRGALKAAPSPRGTLRLSLRQRGRVRCGKTLKANR